MWPFTKKKAPSEIQYAEITTRLTAFTLDLGFLFVFIYYGTKFIMDNFYPQTITLTELSFRAISEHNNLAHNSVAMIQYLILKYPNEIRIALQHIFVGYIVQYLLIGLYIIPMTWKYGGTLGKKFVGIKVVDIITGKNLTLSQSIIRYIGYLPSIIPIGLGVIWGSFHPRKRCLHDFIGDSIVVYDPNRWYKKYFDMLKAYFNLK